MANRIQTLFQALNIPIRFVDINGDGSEYAISATLTGGGGGGGEPVIIPDGADANAGATTDDANTTGATGTLSGKLRGIVTILADVWSDASNAFRVITADGANTALGATTDEAVTNDTTGTAIGFLRGLVAILANVWDNAANAMRFTPTSSDGTEIATAAAPFRVDPTGDTAQPVTDNGSSLTVDSTQLPAALTAGGNLKVAVLEAVDTYATIKSGELAGATSATQLPTITCKRVKLKARASNAGNVYLGGAGVTLPDGTTDTTTGLELLPGDETPFYPVSNLNVFYRICNNAGDALTYQALE